MQDKINGLVHILRQNRKVQKKEAPAIKLFPTETEFS